MIRLHCNDWQELRKALAQGQGAAFEASRVDLHVWARDEPSAGERCQCGARRWVAVGAARRDAGGCP